MTIREDWVKAHTRALHDPKILRLTWEQRGVWWHALLLSKSYSELKGFFINDDRPMTADEIAIAMHAHDDHQLDAVATALRACVDAGLMAYDGSVGFEILNWSKWQSGIAKEDPEKVRARKRRQRARTASPPPHADPPNLTRLGGER